MGKIASGVWSYLKRVDKWLWLCCLAVSCTSVILIYGILQTDYVHLLRLSGRSLVIQAGAIALGIVGALIISIIDYQTLDRLWVIHVPIAYILTILTFFIGVGASGRPDDKRWLIIPIVDVWLQPSEILKISFILFFAYHISKVKDSVNNPLMLLSLLVHAAVPVLLVHFQGDDGTALLILFIAVTMLFMAGISWKYIVPACVALVAVIPIIWNFVLDDFQKGRILILFQAEPDKLGDYYQQYQSKVTIALGKVFGIGLISDQHQYVPEIHNDFIFAFLCESFGFVGAVALLAVMTFMCIRLLRNCLNATDTFGTQICAGICGMIFFQFVINVGMCLSLLPVIGNTFPFLSYGGSSMLSNYLGIGLALSVSMKQKKNLLFSG